MSGHGCTGDRMPLEHDRYKVWFGHGCSGQQMLLEPERYYGLSMDAPEIQYTRT